MRISTKGRYGARAMLELARHYDQGLLRANEIAESQMLSLKYLENLLATLKAAGLLISERGANGGYTLARPPAEITLLDVLRPLEDSLDIVHCTTADDRRCERLDDCVTREVWVELREVAEQVLGGKTLQDLAERRLILDSLNGRKAGSGKSLCSEESDRPVPRSRKKRAGS